jgi:hypothetical protein
MEGLLPAVPPQNLHRSCYLPSEKHFYQSDAWRPIDYEVGRTKDDAVCRHGSTRTPNIRFGYTALSEQRNK